MDLESDDQFHSLLNRSTNIGNSRTHAQRIVSGVSVAIGEIPWIVSIYLRDSFTCGGSLISNRFVLTAAHCFNNAKSSDWFYIRYGSNVVHEGPAVLVKRVILHPNYKPPVIYHDIALLELAQPIQFSRHVQPACLATTQMYSHNMIGMKATVSGYGDSNFEGKQSDFLQAVDIRVIENEFCDKHYRRLAHADEKFRYGIGRTLICAGYEHGKKDACQGDSGGPLTLQIAGIHYQIGIVSFGYRCAQPDFPGIYTAVSHYRHWIINHLQSQTG
ncbi:Group 3 mite allergen-like protein (serine protease) [Euroglyphus maynei]|uniref:Group 3 mite allergen-like protein (Serine protease) n=1 Tax=Euroglyphus maynei TaxID=6958 RepID=A0A1Y3BRP5_EURMA|nr:Group 3 mite allergen-like protein (serine protease) [Euroglyphus maynei]